jgi:hypothetical protein
MGNPQPEASATLTVLGFLIHKIGCETVVMIIKQQ